jgi:hypothetical protein
MTILQHEQLQRTLVDIRRGSCFRVQGTSRRRSQHELRYLMSIAVETNRCSTEVAVHANCEVVWVLQFISTATRKASRWQV